MSLIKSILPLVILLLNQGWTYGHPGGNLIVMGDAAFWSYVDPIDDFSHRACIMKWRPGESPKVIFKSEHPASDFMLSRKEEVMFIIEQRYLQRRDQFEIRILKMTSEEEPTMIWDWSVDSIRIGDGGFYMINEEEIIFGRHPNIYHQKKGKPPAQYFSHDEAIKKIRAVGDEQILLLTDSAVHLADHTGVINKSWLNLIDRSVKDAPLDRNQIFDVDYRNGALLIAYWGKRAFQLIEPDGNGQLLSNDEDPVVPHWVASYGEEMLLFASILVFDGRMPSPILRSFSIEQGVDTLWTVD